MPLALAFALPPSLAQGPSTLLEALNDTLEPIDSRSVEVDYRFGFQDMLFANQPNLACFRLTNQSDHVLQLQLKIEQLTPVPGHGTLRHVHAERAVELGQGSQQTLFIDFPPIHGDPATLLSLVDPEGATLWRRYHHCANPTEHRHQRARLWAALSQNARLDIRPGEENAVPLPNAQPAIAARPQLAHQNLLPAWALPNDPILLATADGVLLDQFAIDRLTPRQERALALYVARGGLLIIPFGASAFETRIWPHLPFPAAVSSPDDREITLGLGAILRYPPSILQTPDTETNAWLYQRLAKQLNRFLPLVNPAVYPGYGGRSRFSFRATGDRALHSKRLCLLTAGLFTLLTGPVAWLFRRTPRRRFLRLLSSTVGAFCLIAILLGQYLKQAKGEVWWSSVTEIPREGTPMQTAVIDCESAGAREHAFALSTPSAYYRSPNPRNAWLTDSSATETGKKRLPLTPWARTLFLVEGFAPEAKYIPCQVELQEGGWFTISWENPNDFRIRNVQCVLASSAPQSVGPAPLQRRRPTRMRRQSFYGAAPVNPGATSVTMQLFNRGGFDLPEHPRSDSPTNRQGVRLRLGGMHQFFARTTGMAAWVIFEIDRSPALAYDPDHSDFEASGSLHYVLQQLPSEELPSPLTFYQWRAQPLRRVIER